MLVRTRGDESQKQAWLLIKENDEAARVGSRITDERPESVATARVPPTSAWLDGEVVAMEPDGRRWGSRLFLLGFWLFRGANRQKHHFKLDPATRIWGRPRPSAGVCWSRDCGGWVGISIYSGEIAIYLAFTLTTGFDSAVPFRLLPLVY